MKQIVKSFNNLIKKTIFKVQNKTNNKLKISSFNKYFITLIGLLFLYIFYLLIPLLYDKSWIQKTIETKLLSEFKMKISTSADISYRILPAPHFLIKNSKILFKDNKNQKSMADVKNLRLFLSQANFFDREKITFTDLIIDNANYSLLRNELSKLNDSNNINFSNKEIKIDNSNFFLKDNAGEIIIIIKMNKANLFFDDEKKLNIFNLKGNIFGIPFTFNFKSKNQSMIKRMINFNAKSLKLDIFNESIVEDNNISKGKNIVSFLNSSLKTEYDVKEKLITFKSDNSKYNSSKINYTGTLSINPFDLDLNIDLGDYKISKLFNPNSIFKELIKSEMFFNDNLSLDATMLANTNARDEIFQKAEINFSIVNGKLNLNKTIFTNNKIGFLTLDNSDLFLKDNTLVLNSDLLITISDSDRLFSLLNTKKSSRKQIKNIFTNLDFNFLNGNIKFNKIKINNNEVNDQFLNLLDEFNDGSSNNVVKSRLLINRLLEAYDG